MFLCKSCNDAPIENKDTGLCATCGREARKNETDDLYPQVKREFLTMLIKNEAECPRCGRPVDLGFDIHHKAGREGYADEWARQMDIPKLIDVRFFLAFDRECHTYIEDHPEFAKKRGWSLPRLHDLIGPLKEEDLKAIQDSVRNESPEASPGPHNTQSI